MELRKISAREEEESMIEMITNVNSAVNNVVWGWPALILLGFTGVLMTSMTGFFQLSHLGHWLKNTIGSIFSDRNITRHTEDRSISQFQSLCTALAATVGAISSVWREPSRSADRARYFGCGSSRSLA